MAVVSTPPSLSSVVSVFGGDGVMSHYVRGGSYVPNIPQNAAISTTAAGLALSQFAGATNYVAVSASVSTTTAGQSAVGTASSRFMTTPQTVTASGSGGTGTYTFAWQYVSGTSLSLSAPSSAGTTFSATVNLNTTVTGVYRCLVSDGTTSAYTPNVTITFTYSSTT